MHRATKTLAAAGGLVLVLSGIAAAVPTIDRPSTIRITDRELSYRRFDEGPRGTGAGDVEIAWQALYNTRVRARPIGHSELICTYLTTRSRNCSATYFLPKGKLVVEGVIGSRLLFELPVVGGTGLYANARGSLVVTTTQEEPRREVLFFRLLP